MTKRTVIERVEEFKKTKKANTAKLYYREMVEISEMFGAALKFCDAFEIISTAFYLGYIKGLRARKGR